MSWRASEPLRIWSTPQKRIRRTFADRRNSGFLGLARASYLDLARSVMHSDPANGEDDVFGAELPRAKTSLEHEMKLRRGTKR
eukprot:scaffold6656_cov149-Pinguiococcus_pyrenoidosus.AAC.3